MSYGVYRRYYIAPPPPQVRLLATSIATAQIRNNANTTVTLLGDDYRIEKTSGGSADNADAVGTVALTGDFIIAVHVIDDDINIHLGVSADATTSSSYAAIQRAIQFYRPDNKVYYYESGVLDTVGSFSYIAGVAPYVWMRRIGTTITVLSNTVDDIGTATLQKTMTALGGTVYFDSAFFDVGDKIDVNLGTPVIGALAGATSLTFSPSGNLTGAGALSGASALTFAPVGNLTGAGVLSGVSSLAFSPTGNLLGLAPLSGASSLTFTAAGAILGLGQMSGASSITFSPTGLLTGAGALVGASSLTFAPTGLMVGSGALAGVSSLTFSLTGLLSDQRAAMIRGRRRRRKIIDYGHAIMHNVRG